MTKYRREGILFNILCSFVYCIVEQDHIKICSTCRVKNIVFFIMKCKCSNHCHFVDNLWNKMECNTSTTRTLQSVCRISIRTSWLPKRPHNVFIHLIQETPLWYRQWEVELIFPVDPGATWDNKIAVSPEVGFGKRAWMSRAKQP